MDRRTEFVDDDEIVRAENLAQTQALLLLTPSKGPQRADDSCGKRHRADTALSLRNVHHRPSVPDTRALSRSAGLTNAETAGIGQGCDAALALLESVNPSITQRALNRLLEAEWNNESQSAARERLLQALACRSPINGYVIEAPGRYTSRNTLAAARIAVNHVDRSQRLHPWWHAWRTLHPNRRQPDPESTSRVAFSAQGSRMSRAIDTEDRYIGNDTWNQIGALITRAGNRPLTTL